MEEGDTGNGEEMDGNPPTRKPLPRVRKPNLHSDRGQDSNPCTWRPLGPQSTHDSTLPRFTTILLKNGTRTHWVIKFTMKPKQSNTKLPEWWKAASGPPISLVTGVCN
ncbi:hypothetical protein E2C01_070334 [Portunus trituberculatus]|uniref:Uncharacterized protein n=1 Tax=Portunus trituberculatus TaxID=210409 RepID=A0A5B7I548_PORTR|nr:hypothetical protein [Portunus trituberculatus]